MALNKELSEMCRFLPERSNYFFLATLVALLCTTCEQIVAAEPDDTIFIEEIVVTSERREQPLHRTALSISSFGAQTINEAGLVNLTDIAHFTPGLVVTSYNPTSPTAYIRGVGTSSSSVGDDSSIGMFIDGVYMGRAGAQSTDMYDIERIEVLRGPQGALYGRNVIGGLMNVLTSAPSRDTSAELTAGYGSDNLVETKGYTTGALTEKIAGRLSFAYRRADGFAPNIVTGNRLKDKNNLGIRGKLKFELSEHADLLISADYAKDKLKGPAARTVAGFEDLFGSAPVVEPDDHRVSLFEDGFSNRYMWGLNGTLNVATSLGQFTSITGYRDQRFSFVDDLLDTNIADALRLSLVNDATETSSSFSQEFRLQSRTGEQLRWTMGMYFFREDVSRVESFDSTRTLALRNIGSGISRPVWDARNRTNSISAYADASYSVSERLAITIGARVTHDKKLFDINATGPDFFGFLAEDYSVAKQHSWSDLSPRVSANYIFSTTLMGYASFATGYKAGGFNGLAPDSSQASFAFNPETATNYETGFKWRTQDGTATINASAFYLDYKDLQTFFGSGSGFLTVTSDARSYGIEIEGTMQATSSLQFSASYGWLDARFKSFAPQPAFSNNRLPRSPTHSLQGSARYSQSISETWSLTLRSDVTYQGAHFFSAANNPLNGDDGYVLLDASLYLSNLTGWSISVKAKNLLDEKYFQHAFNFASQEMLSFPVLAEKRRFALHITKQF